MNYLDSRPNSHGLFSEKDNLIVLDKAAKEVANHKGALWTHIVSLKRTGTERMGYIDLEHWRDLVRRHISDIAEAQKIADKNIRCYAAFHNKETNPHVHIVTYSVDPKEGYLTKEGIEKIRSTFANDIYRDELQNLYHQQTIVRDKLRSEAKSVIQNLLSELKSSSLDNPEFEQLVLKLQTQLKNAKGKKIYGYLPPYVTLPFKLIQNRGEKDQYYVKATHEAIIEKSVFENVQKIFAERETSDGMAKEKSPFRKKIICKNCGMSFRRKAHKNFVCWVCRNHDLSAENCCIRQIKESEFQIAFVRL